MSERSTERESSFTWPPPADDMDQLSILDLSARQLPDDLAPAAQALQPSPPVQPARAQRRRFPRVRPQLWQRAGRQVAAASGRFGLFTAGMIAGAVLVGAVIEPSALENGISHSAPAALDATAEGHALRAMQALLRGDRPAAASAVESVVLPAGAPSPAPVEHPPSPPAEDAGPTPPPAPPPGTGASTPMLVAAPGSNAAHGSPLSESVTRTPVAPRMDSRTMRVRYALGAYERAVTRSDAAAARKVWPSANEKALTNSFSAVREQRLQLGACDVDVHGERATAICRGTLRYRPRVGDHSTRVRRGQWDFQLERTQGQQWVIRSVDAP